MTYTTEGIREFSRDELILERQRLEKTVQQIEGSMQAPNFYEGDREEVQRNLDHFRRVLASVERALSGTLRTV